MMNPLRSAAAKAGLQSASIMTLADAATQVLVEKRSPVANGDLDRRRRYDPLRTLLCTAVGLALHGPYFLLAFRKLDRTLGGGSGLPLVLKKTAAAQLVVFPPYLVALFASLGAMERGGGGGVRGVVRDVRERVPDAFLAGCVFWPVANCVNFALVPAGARVPYLAAAGGLWNSYLSHMNAEKGEIER